MSVDRDQAASAFIELMHLFMTAASKGWERESPGVLASVSGGSAPTLNGVWVHGIGATQADVADLLDQVAATGLPYCIQARPGLALDVGRLAAARGMSREDDIPLMVLSHPGALVDASADTMSIRQLRPEEAPLFARTAAAGFEAPSELFVELLTPQVLGLRGVRAYVGEADGTVVTTGMGITVGPSIGIVNIATLPAHRRRGHGAAVTARAVADGFAAGATWAWLHSSPAGFPVYGRLGFRTVESWSCWVASPAP